MTSHIGYMDNNDGNHDHKDNDISEASTKQNSGQSILNAQWDMGSEKLSAQCGCSLEDTTRCFHQLFH